MSILKVLKEASKWDKAIMIYGLISAIFSIWFAIESNDFNYFHATGFIFMGWGFSNAMSDSTYKMMNKLIEEQQQLINYLVQEKQ